MAKIVVLGGGVAGMTVAHELSERGFQVTVYEKKLIAGGKARSLGIPGSGPPGKELPAEHGFRFFPGFYRHLPETMQRIPYRIGANGQVQSWVYDNLVPTPEITLAQKGRPELVSPLHRPTSLSDWRDALAFMFGVFTEMYAGSIPTLELLYLAKQLLVVLTSCEERRFRELEKENWWQFAGADKFSPAYKRLLIGLPRTLGAMKAEDVSVRSGGVGVLRLQFDMLNTTGRVDQVLNGPTNQAWIDPWLAYLKLAPRSVDYRTGQQVQQIHYGGGQITGVDVLDLATGATQTVTADYYVFAVPVEVMRGLLTDDLRTADPDLAHLDTLGDYTSWMTGVQFYLPNDVTLGRGHTVYIDSPWALTSISQQQFWPLQLGTLGTGQARGVISVDVSDWFTPSNRQPKRPASECNSDEVKREVWAQLRDHLPGLLPTYGNLVGAWVDDSIVFQTSGTARNDEPFFINKVNSWRLRPKAYTQIPNLFLAADYVQTATDLTTMEGANEAARRAVN
ncbi:MAG TPA: FAD-dependent oxidoreductase, partial [Actinomycetota bacterium]|nr:FAD-dependent oxidoreductase [Actinomycetota bacterium]